MRTTRISLLSLSIGLLLAPRVLAQTSNCICSGYNTDRTLNQWSFVNGDVFSRARTNLLDGDFFGPSSKAVKRSITVNAGAQLAQDATLSGVHIFFTGYADSSNIPESERTALRNAVLNNGMSIVITSDDATHDFSSLFGVTFEPVGTGMNSIAALPDHPILAGPFGRISQFRGAEKYGAYRSWPAGTLVLAVSNSGPTMLLIPRGILTPTAGAVLFLSDIDALTTYTRATAEIDSDPGLAVTDALMMNIVAYLCNPTSIAAAPQLIFPQFAAGQSNVSLLNLTNSGLTQAPITINLYEGNGFPFIVPIAGIGQNSEFTATLVPNQTAVYLTASTSTLRTGWAAVRGPSTVGGNVIYHAPGLGVTSVSASPVAGAFAMPIIQQPAVASQIPTSVDVYQGVAICNLQNKKNRIRFELWDDLGKRGDGVRYLDLPANGQEAVFLHDTRLYGSYSLTNFKGTLRIIGTNGLISAVGIQVGTIPGQFSALPMQPVYR